MSQLSPPLAPAPEAPADQSEAPEQLVALSIFIELALLALVLLIGRSLDKWRFQFLGAAGASLLIGLLVGSGMVQGDIFLYVALPTIIFDAGYQCDPKPFLHNLGAICTYAFLGTTMSTFIIGFLMWAFGLAGICYRMSLMHNLAYGAIISATDPVTVLSVFQSLGADKDLYITVFGEAILNDAVAQVLYDTISALIGKTITARAIFIAIAKFFGIFAGSVAIGITVGLLAAAVFRSQFFRDDGCIWETGLAIIFAYMSYMAASAATLSGITAVLFCGMIMNAYARPNLSYEAQEHIHSFFKVLSGVFDIFLFMYIGLSLFLQTEHYDVWSYTALCLLTLGVARFFSVYPITAVVNYLRTKERRITQKQQFVLWWSGLRGAMAFGLAIVAAEKFGEQGEVMKTCTFYVVFVTVLINGGGAAFLVEKLKLREEDTERRRLKRMSQAVSASPEQGARLGALDVSPDNEDDPDSFVQLDGSRAIFGSPHRYNMTAGTDGSRGDSTRAGGQQHQGSYRRPGIPFLRTAVARMREMTHGQMMHQLARLDQKIEKVLVVPRQAPEPEGTLEDLSGAAEDADAVSTVAEITRASTFGVRDASASSPVPRGLPPSDDITTTSRTYLTNAMESSSDAEDMRENPTVGTRTSNSFYRPQSYQPNSELLHHHHHRQHQQHQQSQQTPQYQQSGQNPLNEQNQQNQQNQLSQQNQPPRQVLRLPSAASSRGSGEIRAQGSGADHVT